MPRGFFQKSVHELGQLWALTRFHDPGLARYAENLLLRDTREGVMALGLVSLLLLAFGAFYYMALGFDQVYIYSYSILAFLSGHMYFSARAINDIKALYLLGIAILIIDGVVLVLTAHQLGTISLSLFASVVLLFLVMPLVPWGLREGMVIVVMLYAVFTLSTLSVDGRFDNQTLSILQFVLLAAGLSTLTVIGRTAVVRKNDFQARYELEKARSKMERLSLVDPLTNAWNRRFLEQNFADIVAGYRVTNDQYYFAVIDVDNFKTLNDTFGHDYGDLVLVQISTLFQEQFNQDSYLVRLGGDEFALLYAGSGPEATIRLCAEQVANDKALLELNPDMPVIISSGVVIVPATADASLETIYQQADKALYQAKKRPGEQKMHTGIETAGLVITS